MWQLAFIKAFFSLTSDLTSDKYHWFSPSEAEKIEEERRHLYVRYNLEAYAKYYTLMGKNWINERIDKTVAEVEKDYSFFKIIDKIF